MVNISGEAAPTRGLSVGVVDDQLAKTHLWSLRLLFPESASAFPHLRSEWASAFRKAAELLRKAAELYQKGADQGRAFAQVNLGWLYENGQGVPKDLEKAAELYQKAANHGYQPAIANLKRLSGH